MAGLRVEMDELKAEVAELRAEMDELKAEVEKLKADMESLKDHVARLESRTTAVELTLENETNKGIHIIAEGHQDLDRKLNQALKIEEEKEVLMLRVNYLESELCKVKNKLKEIA